MLNYFTDKKRAKSIQLAEESVDKGLEFLKQKQYGRAGKEFEQSVKYDKEKALSLLEPQYKAFDSQKLIKEAIVIGDILYLHQQKTFEFLNHLGNLCRKSGNSKKANELYKRAFKIGKNDETAFLNLAASIAKIPVYDQNIRKLLDKHIDINNFILPQSDYPRNQEMHGHLAEALNKKHYFKKVEKMQELILEKELKDTTAAIANTDQMMTDIRKKLAGNSDFDESSSDVKTLLKEALDHDWNRLLSGEKDEFLWSVLSLGLYVLNERESLIDKENKDGSDPTKNNLKMALDVFVKLKAEQYSFRYLDMLISITHFLLNENEKHDEIDTFKDILSRDPNDRYFNINLGIYYHRTGNKLMSYVFLIKGASIIEKLEGACNLSDIIDLADDKYSQGKLSEALKLYRLASLETDDIDLLVGIGKTLISLNKFYEAIQPLKDAVRLNPRNQIAQNELLKLQEHFCFLADEFYRVGTYVPAADNYQHALEIDHTPHIMLKAMQAYKMQGNHVKEHEIREEYNTIKASQKQKEKESNRIRLVQQGKKQLKLRKLNEAISSFESAFKIKTDRDTFMYLVYLYKKLNQKNALTRVVQRWHQEHPKKNEN